MKLRKCFARGGSQRIAAQRIAAMREAVAATHIVLSREQWFEILRASNGCDVP
jgi:predicted oxidoreductase